MSSKKARRRARQEREKTKGGRNPATLFILFIIAALLAVGLAAAFIDTGGSAPPGGVWSAEHQHWH